MFLVNEDTRKQLEILEKEKATLQMRIRELSSRRCCMPHNCFGLTNLTIAFNSSATMDEYQRKTLLYQLYDIQSKIDELKSKN